MNSHITIETEMLNKGSWIKINIPKNRQPASSAIISSKEGEILKEVTLAEGCNAIDISGITGNSINIKVETAYETVLKNIKLNHL